MAILSYGYTVEFLFDINLSVKCLGKNNVCPLNLSAERMLYGAQSLFCNQA
jgi:hypothetical protein